MDAATTRWKSAIGGAITLSQIALSKLGILTNAGSLSSEFSKAASSGARALALSEIAVAWLFLGGFSAEPINPLQNAGNSWPLVVALVASIASLVIDFAQYATATLGLGKFSSDLEAVLREANMSGSPRSINTEHSWRRLADRGFVEDLLRLDPRFSPATLQNYTASISRAKNNLSEVALPNPDRTIYEETLKFLESPWIPGRITASVLGLFKAKVSAVAVSSVSIGFYIVTFYC